MADIQAKLLEEKISKGIRAKIRFKAAVRNVIYNFSWIQEHEDDYDYYKEANRLSIQQNISKLHRTSKEADGQLKIEEISILRKDAKYRTEDEIKLLNKYIGGLKCFRLFPEDVRMELVKVTYFEYYGPKRTLIKENQSGHALYFLLTGEVLIYKLQLDVIEEKYVQVLVHTTTAGNMFGEISLLHNVPRTATVITSAPCQLLVLKKDDFDRVLKKNLMQQWEEISESMLKFEYFNHWTAVKIRECCMLSAIERYKPNEVIYGDKDKSKEKSEMTYFVVEGTCAVVEHLFIQETVKYGRTYYKSYVPPDPIMVELSSIGTVEKLINGNSIKNSSTDFSPSKAEKFDTYSGSKASTWKSVFTWPYPKFNDSNSNAINYLQKELNLDEEKHTIESTIQLPSNVKLRFMQVCTFKELATFSEGKLMDNRRVISLTPVKVMTIPIYWLTAHSKGNVWSRIEEYQKVKIPSNQDVFKAYVNRQKYQEYRRKLRNDILSKKKSYNSTTVHDVPYSIRVMSNYEN